MQLMFERVWSELDQDELIGIGTGRTIEAWLAYGFAAGYKLSKAVASSARTADILQSNGVELYNLSDYASLNVYIDSADEVDPYGNCIKGGGGAMTFEKILRSTAAEFICLIDKKKYRKTLGDFPLALEVLPDARSYVGREILKIGGDPVYREGFLTDSSNVVIDAYGLNFTDPQALELKLNSILGICGHGLFAVHAADTVYIATENSFDIKKMKKS